MTEKVNGWLDHDTPNWETQKSTGFIPKTALLKRLTRSKDARARFVESHLKKSIAFQIRALREREQWTQAKLAKQLGMRHQNNVSARLENSHYGKHSLTTLKKIAAGFDVALVVWFIPFSRLIDWVTETPYNDKGLTEDFYNVPAFDEDPGIKDLAAKEAEEDAFIEEPGSPQGEEKFNGEHSSMRSTMEILEQLGNEMSWDQAKYLQQRLAEAIRRHEETNGK